MWWSYGRVDAKDGDKNLIIDNREVLAGISIEEIWRMDSENYWSEWTAWELQLCEGCKVNEKWQQCTSSQAESTALITGSKQYSST